MSVTVLLGAQWGDEGKGKVLDFLIGHHKVSKQGECLFVDDSNFLG
jgi:adenylosuccinate synthase